MCQISSVETSSSVVVPNQAIQNNASNQVGENAFASSTTKNQSNFQYVDYIDIYMIIATHLLAPMKDLINRGFPFFRKGETTAVILPTVYTKNKKMWLNQGDQMRNCCRCQIEFKLSKNGKKSLGNCVHHPNKPIFDNVKCMPVYPCCGKMVGEPGCKSNQLHVFDQLFANELNKIVMTPMENGVLDYKSLSILAIDCEMVYTIAGPALARMTVVDWYGKMVLDVRVNPKAKLLDANTQFSGLTEEDIRAACLDLNECRQKLFGIIDRNTILVGHSLENDLKALRLSHIRIVDTSMLYQTTNYKPSLRNLTQEYLGKSIQSDIGHDSEEDARTCIELLKHYIENHF